MQQKAILPTLVLLAATACDARSDDAAEAGDLQHEHASLDFPAEVNGQEHILTYEGTHDVLRDEDPEVTHVTFIHHGAAQNPVTYFENAVAALREATQDEPELGVERRTMVLAPAKIGERHVEDHPERYSGGHYPYWPGGWREGEDSVNEPVVSNFDLLDAMALHVAEAYPAVESMVFAGHSAGGQVMSRYAVGSPVHDELRDRGIAVRYVISNPSSFLYLDRSRPELGGEGGDGGGFVEHAGGPPEVDGEPCPDFNDYRYGFDGDVAEYMTRRPAEAMTEGFAHREVFIFQGAEDNDPRGAALDTSCPAMTQGRHRLERGERYYEYLGELYGPEVYETTFLEVVEGVGHSHADMFASEEGKRILFLDHLE